VHQPDFLSYDHGL